MITTNTQNENNSNLVPPSYYGQTLKKCERHSLSDDKMNILNKKFDKKPKIKKFIMVRQDENTLLNYDKHISFTTDDALISKLFQLKDSGMIIKKSFIL